MSRQRKFQRFSLEQQLRPWPAVTEKWNEVSGETITQERVKQIAAAAAEKIRRGVAGDPIVCSLYAEAER